MFCPNCAEKRESDAGQFCRGCGHPFAGSKASRSGLKQGFVLIAFGLLLIPVWMFIGGAFPANDRLVESSPSTTWPEMVAWILMWVALLAGAARIAYSMIFESRDGESRAVEEKPDAVRGELSSADSFEAARPGRWRSTTSDLFEPVVSKQRTSGEL